MTDPSQCVVLVPAGSGIDPGCEDGLRELERRRYPVWRARGYSALDIPRSQMATDALAQGFQELLWIDADVVFDPNDVEKLRRHDLPLVCGIYPKKARRQFACAFLPEMRQVVFGAKGGVVEILYGGFGFVLTRRPLYETMQRQLKLPVCNKRSPSPLVPYFAPLIAGEGEEACYLGEDYAFCERARRCGFRVLADTTIRLWQVGAYRFGWEDAGRDVERFPDYTLHLTGAAPPPAVPSLPPPHEEESRREEAVRSPRNDFQESVRPLPASFPRLRAYCVSYPANHESLQVTLEDFRHSDWGEEPIVFMQPEDWPPGKPSAARNYRRVLEHAYEDGCDFALILEDDVRVNRHLWHNLTTLPLIRRDQCDYLSLFLPDLIVAPWQRQERHLGYRLAKPLYAGPKQIWQRHRIWGSQAYVLSRRFLRAALERWNRLGEGQDARVLFICDELQLPLWYTYPCLVEHAPLTSVFATPAAHAPDFDPDFRLEIGPGFQPPEAIPGWLTVEEGALLWEHAAGCRVLELGTGLGRSTVCLAQQARQVVTIDRLDQAEASEWSRRYQVHDRIVFRQGEIERIAAHLEGRFDLVSVDTDPDEASVRRDIETALRVLEPGGQIAVHDYPDPRWPDVRRVVDDYARRLGWRRIVQANFLGIFRLPSATT
ncbi:MAG TPA: class I SAM-dependent methyltransferase [Gemmataceae bacterium]|nr:class I SAM-dependent methyltransferase [Gemmataceae bacterium]